MEKLPKLFKKQWLKALRSGNYLKGESRLKEKKDDGKTYWCCLGVAGDLCGVRGMCGSTMEKEFLDFDENPNLRGRKKVPLAIQGSDNGGTADKLASLNDADEDFERVIAYIEDNL